MKILNTIKNEFKNFNKRAYILLIIGMTVSALLFVLSIILYIIGGVREQNMITYYAGISGDNALSIFFIGVITSIFVNMIEKGSAKEK